MLTQLTERSSLTLDDIVSTTAAIIEQGSAIRRCFLVDVLGAAYLPRYEIDGVAHVIDRDGYVQSYGKANSGYCEWLSVLNEHDDALTVPIHELHVHADLFFFKTLDQSIKAVRGVAESFIREENKRFINLIENVRADQVVSADYTEVCGGINNGFRFVERHDMVVAHVVTNEKTYKKICAGDKTGCIRKPSYSKGCLAGSIFTADFVLVEDDRLDDVAYCLAVRDYVGVLPERQKITAMSDPTTNGLLLYYQVGFAFLHQYAVSKIEFCSRLR